MKKFTKIKKYLRDLGIEYHVENNEIERVINNQRFKIHAGYILNVDRIVFKYNKHIVCIERTYDMYHMEIDDIIDVYFKNQYSLVTFIDSIIMRNKYTNEQF